jgi:hypothetical protein
VMVVATVVPVLPIPVTVVKALHLELHLMFRPSPLLKRGG